MNNHTRFSIVLACLVSVCISSTAYAVTTTPFHDDFQDGDHVGWSVTNTGGAGDTGVDLNPGINFDQDNLAAWASHQGWNSHSLSQDFSFSPNDKLTFDMQARANSVSGASASSGLTISFLDSLNTDLGSTSFWYSTVGDGNIPDQNWHTYTGSMEQLTALAGTNLVDPTKMSLSFWAAGQTSFFGNSSATVWFDNVEVSAVPLPAAVWLFGSGLLGLVGISRRRKLVQ